MIIFKYNHNNGIVYALYRGERTKMKHKNAFTRFLILLIVFSVTVSLVMPSAVTSAYAITGSTKQATSISSCPSTLNVSKSKKAVVSATIAPASGRLVMLQRYSSSTNKWTTISRKNVANASSAKISFSIPAKYRQKTTSVWRLYAPETAAAASVSRKVTLTTRNIKSYKLSAKAACIYRIDGNGQGTLIYAKNANVKRAQASTTKLMTAVLLLESGMLDFSTTISRHAASTPWGSNRLTAGDVYKNSDLLYAMLLPSANDAATAVAEAVSGSEETFVEYMNLRARSLGLKKTSFCNPHGLDADGHYTTAKELAMLTAYAYTFPEIRGCWKTSSKTIQSLRYGKKWTLWSSDSILGYISNFLGGKTGTEDNAGCCFTGAYKYKGSVYITVVLGSGYGVSRWTDTKKLHKYIRKYAATRY